MSINFEFCFFIRFDIDSLIYRIHVLFHLVEFVLEASKTIIMNEVSEDICYTLFLEYLPLLQLVPHIVEILEMYKLGRT